VAGITGTVVAVEGAEELRPDGQLAMLGLRGRCTLCACDKLCVLGTLVDRDTVCCNWAKFAPIAGETNERRGRTAAAERQPAGSSNCELPDASLCGGGLRLVNLDGGPLVG